MNDWYYEKQRKARELKERNGQGTRQFLTDRYNEGYQEIEVGKSTWAFLHANRGGKRAMEIWYV